MTELRCQLCGYQGRDVRMDDIKDVGPMALCEDGARCELRFILQGFGPLDMLLRCSWPRLWIPPQRVEALQKG